jgi:hypothetical protein
VPLNLGVGYRRRQGVEIGGLWKPQAGACTQNIDVAAECLGVLLENGDHHLIDGNALGPQPIRYRPQRLGALHGTVNTAGCRRG